MSKPTFKLRQHAGGLRCSAVSDVGMRRSNNQDSMAVCLATSTQQWRSHGHLFMVADGMGAHAAGELASKMATDSVPHTYQKNAELSPSEAIVAAMREANSQIYNKGSNSVDFQGMGTTCTCLLLLPFGALAAHVGDSRVYRLRGDSLEQFTFDHSLVWEMAAAGQASEEDVPSYVPKNVITRSLGPHPTVSVDVEGPFSLQNGDRFLLCSDGLTGPLNPELIGAVLSSLPLDDAAQTLVDLANLLGGPDNITCVVAEVEEIDRLGHVQSPADPEPPRRRTRGMQAGVHPLCWIAMTACAMLGGIMLAAAHPLAAAVAAAGFAAAVYVAWSQHKSAVRVANSSSLIDLHGKAPYRRHNCAPSADSIGTLGDIVRQLEDLEGQSQWDIDWQTIQQERQQAYEAITKSDYQTAVVAYCSAVRRLMQALREGTGPGPTDSSLDL